MSGPLGRRPASPGLQGRGAASAIGASSAPAGSADSAASGAPAGSGASNAGPPAGSGADRWRILADAQREADTMFAQYQLSQLLASGDSLWMMTRAVLHELVRNTQASVGALWLAPPGSSTLELVSVAQEDAGPVTDGRSVAGDGIPATFASAAAALLWARARDWYAVTLEETHDTGAGALRSEATGVVALLPAPGGRLASDHARLLGLVRHELATALRAAQLREMLVRERAMLSAILDGASDAIVAVDAGLCVVRVNPAALALLDVANPVGMTCESLLGCRRPLLVLAHRPGIPPALACGDHCPFEEVLSGAPPIAGRERELQGREGPVPVAGSYALMPGESGAVGVLRDLRPGRELDDLKSSFVAAVSHELRTPLALISGYVQTLINLEFDEERRRYYLEQIQAVTERLTGLVNQILEIARLESDQLQLDRHPASLAAIVAGATAELGDGAVAPPIGLQVPLDLPPLWVDPDRLQQVVSNLLSNAIKYAGPRASIHVRARKAEDGRVVVSVVDNGPGVAEDERPFVFERFYRGRAVGQSRTPGSGLGLYLCRRIIEAHGGEIWLDEPKAGASVSFSIPMAVNVRSGRALS